MAVQHRLMTVEEFWEQYEDKPYELINGEVVETVPTGILHGAVERRVAKALGNFVDDHHLGEVLVGELGVQLGPNTLRAADVAFVSNARLKSVADPQKYLAFAPDLAIEVVSPGNTIKDIDLKVEQYLQAGTVLVWVVYPEARKVIVHQVGAKPQTIGEDGALDGGDVLPGLAIPVADLFPPAQSG